MSDQETITDIANVRARAAATAAEPGMIAIQNVAGTLKQVTDLGVVSDLGGGGLGSLTATVVKSTAGVASAATVNTDYGPPVKEYYTSLSAQGTSLTLSGLDGDTDGLYLVHIEMLSNAATNNLEIQLNGAATNLQGYSSNGLVGAALSTNWKIAQATQSPATFSSGDRFNFFGMFSARSGRKRLLQGQAFVVKGGTNTGFQFIGEYTDTATNVTSMSILASQANGLAATSFIHCVRVQTTNPLA